MHQFGRVFGTTRVPQTGQDTLYQDAESKHIVLLRKGALVRVPGAGAGLTSFVPFVLFLQRRYHRIGEERTMGENTGQWEDSWQTFS